MVASVCADGGTRTPTPQWAPDPKSGASTNSATSAYGTANLVKVIDFAIIKIIKMNLAG